MDPKKGRPSQSWLLVQPSTGPFVLRCGKLLKFLRGIGMMVGKMQKKEIKQSLLIFVFYMVYVLCYEDLFEDASNQ